MTRTSLMAAYLQRLSIGGALSPTYGTLCGLQHAHMLTIPFENIDVLMGRPIRLELDAIRDKLLLHKRGGYCFEHNVLFRAVLTELGFETAALAGRVHMGTPAGVVPARTHMLLRVELPEGPFIADAAGLGPRHPIPLHRGAESVFGHEHHRLQRVGDDWLLQQKIEGNWVDIYSFTLEARHPVDVEVHNHYTSTHPRSRFVQHLLVRRATVEGNLFVRDDQVVVVNEQGSTRSTLTSRQELYELLRDQFSLDVPEVKRLVVPAVAGWR